MELKETKLTPIDEWKYFPRFALTYFAWALLFLATGAIVLDRLVLPYLENRGILSCEAWLRQNEKLFRFMAKRNHATITEPLFRTDGFPVSEKCPKAKRILVLGDSFVWGHGVANMNYIWWRQLQQELQRRGYNDVEVIAAGMCGATTHLELDWAPNLVKKYHPDLLLWSYVTNDPIETDDKGEYIVLIKSVDMDTKMKGFAAQVYNFLPNLVYHLVDIRSGHERLAKSNAELGFDYAECELEVLKGRNFEQYKKTVQGVAQFISKYNIPTLFVMMVYPDPGYMTPRLEPVEKVFRENKIDYLDFTSTMTTWYQNRFKNVQGKPQFVLGVCPVDPHPGPLATHYYAVQTADSLEKNYLSCLGPKSNPPSPVDKQPVINDWFPHSLNLKEVAENTYSLQYPDSLSEQITMPIRRPYVQLNMQRPSIIKKIEINGDDLSSAAVALGLEDSKLHEYQLSHMPDLGFKKGKSLSFSLSDITDPVADLKLSANFSGANRNLLIKLITQ